MKESGEMYLENILVISRNKGSVRAIDIAEYSGYSKAAVSRAIAKLKGEGHIVVNQTGIISFTESGREIAEKIYERHVVISSMLEMIGVCKKTATEDACKIEHVISDETMNAIKIHKEKIGEKAK